MVNLILIFVFLLPSGKERLRVRIDIDNHKEVYTLLELGVSIEHLKLDYVETHLSLDMMEKVKNAGFNVEILPPEKFPRAGYHSYNQMVAKLDSIIDNYPGIAKKMSIGTSVEGRNLWVLKISDNVNVDEAEPEIRFIGIIHGDEPIGCENLLRLADTLTKRYGIDPFFTSLVDDREIYLMPMFNPDGREASSRYNANGVDLNRDFPVPDGGSNGGSQPGMESETRALIEWSDTMDFVLSVTYHSGARVVNYQWDYTHDLPPFMDVIRRISIGYATRNDSIFNDPDPSYADSGTVRGSEWYIVRGSVQDWAYDSTDCIDLTIELDPIKWPSSSKLPNLWVQNRESMLWLIDQAGKGVRGMVLDHYTGDPLVCTYHIDGVNKTFSNDPIGGDFYRPLVSGTYTFVFESPGYNNRVIPGVEVEFEFTTNLNVEMWPYQAVTINGTVTDTEGNPIDSSYVEVIGITSVYSNSEGVYSLNANTGELYFRVSKEGYTTVYDTVLVENDTTVDFTLQGLNQYDFFSTTTLDIPDGDPLGITDSIYIEGALSISDVFVYMDITHTYIGDLIVRVKSPFGTSVTLHNRSGGSNDDIVGWYDSPLSVDGPGSLEDIDGENASGWWKLFVSDNVLWDTGTLNQWGIRVYTPDSLAGTTERRYSLKIKPIPPIVPGKTRVDFSVPGSGNYTLRLIDISGRVKETIFKDAFYPGGSFSIDHRFFIPSGIYILRLESVDGRAASQKIVMLK